jgi:membrane protease YdiL (CAAX protease family)
MFSSATTRAAPDGTANADEPALPARTAWRNAAAITLVGVLLGASHFVLLADYLSRTTDALSAAIWLQVAFTIGLGLVFCLIAAWQRAHGSSLKALGLGKPTSAGAVTLGVVVGAAWLGLSYMGARDVLPDVDTLAFSWIRVALAPLGIAMAVAEETMMRGFFLTQLHRAGVPAWLQVLASGICSATYHSLSLGGFVASAVIFSVMAALYVRGGRSLTPSIVAHSIIHVLGAPYLLMMVLAMLAQGSS